MKKTAKRKGYIDRSETFDEFLDKDGLLSETEDAAIKRIIADQIGQHVLIRCRVLGDR